MNNLEYVLNECKKHGFNVEVVGKWVWFIDSDNRYNGYRMYHILKSLGFLQSRKDKRFYCICDIKDVSRKQKLKNVYYNSKQ